MMEEEKLCQLMLLDYSLTEEDIWTSGQQEDPVKKIKKPRKKRSCWVREWIQRRHDDPSNTQYKLQLEIAAVGYLL